jgi:hypothetical protein
MKYLVFGITWFMSCVVFDGILELQGGWLMGAGALSYMFSDYLSDKIA